MDELTNCPNCGAIFYKNKFREVCQDCWKEEEKAYETVYNFMRKRENRAATIQQVEESTGIKEELILKFIRNGKLKIAQFPNFGYPCDRCGHIIRKGNLCDKCTTELRNELEEHTESERRRIEREKREKQITYFTMKKD